MASKRSLDARSAARYGPTVGRAGAIGVAVRERAAGGGGRRQRRLASSVGELSASCARRRPVKADEPVAQRSIAPSWRSCASPALRRIASAPRRSPSGVTTSIRRWCGTSRVPPRLGLACGPCVIESSAESTLITPPVAPGGAAGLAVERRGGMGAVSVGPDLRQVGLSPVVSASAFELFGHARQHGDRRGGQMSGILPRSSRRSDLPTFPMDRRREGGTYQVWAKGPGILLTWPCGVTIPGCLWIDAGGAGHCHRAFATPPPASSGLAVPHRRCVLTGCDLAKAAIDQPGSAASTATLGHLLASIGTI